MRLGDMSRHRAESLDRGLVVMAGEFTTDGAGAVDDISALPPGFTVTKTGTGVYQVDFPEAFSVRFAVQIGTVGGTTTTISASQFVITNGGGTPADLISGHVYLLLIATYTP